jgi:hypothetical protein
LPQPRSRGANRDQRLPPSCTRFAREPPDAVALHSAATPTVDFTHTPSALVRGMREHWVLLPTPNAIRVRQASVRPASARVRSLACASSYFVAHTHCHDRSRSPSTASPRRAPLPLLGRLLPAACVHRSASSLDRVVCQSKRCELRRAPIDVPSSTMERLYTSINSFSSSLKHSHPTKYI